MVKEALLKSDSNVDNGEETTVISERLPAGNG